MIWSKNAWAQCFLWEVLNALALVCCCRSTCGWQVREQAGFCPWRYTFQKGEGKRWKAEQERGVNVSLLRQRAQAVSASMTFSTTHQLQKGRLGKCVSSHPVLANERGVSFLHSATELVSPLKQKQGELTCCSLGSSRPGSGHALTETRFVSCVLSLC